MVDGVFETGPRWLVLTSPSPTLPYLEVAAWAVFGSCVLVLLLFVLVGIYEFVQRAFREGRSWAVWISWNWLSILLLAAAAATVARLLRDPAPFLSQGVSKPAVERWQFWAFAVGCVLFAVRCRVSVRPTAVQRRKAEPVAEKDRGAE